MAIDMGSELDNQNRMIERINTKVIKLCSTLTPSECMPHFSFTINLHTLPHQTHCPTTSITDVDDENSLTHLTYADCLFVFLFSSSPSFFFAVVFLHASTGRIQRNKDSGGKRTSSSASQINTHFLCLTLFYSFYVYLFLINLNLNYIYNILYIHTHMQILTFKVRFFCSSNILLNLKSTTTKKN